MTPDELRALDAEVAVKVFGWTREQVALAMLCADGSIAACSEMTTGHIPEYSTDIAAAWLVVERLNAMGYSIHLHQFHASIGGGWSVDVHCPFGPCKLHGTTEHDCHGVDDVIGGSAPLAICKAALAAVKAQAEGGR